MAVVSTAAAGLRAAPRATVLQLRAPLLTSAELEREAKELVESSPIPVLISSRCDVCLSVGAAGVNLPARDIGIVDARELLGHRVVGRSVHSLEEAELAAAAGADFVIFGPVWPSATHPDTPAAGIEALALIARSVKVPVIAIGGVTEARVVECLGAGAAGHAAIGIFR